MRQLIIKMEGQFEIFREKVPELLTHTHIIYIYTLSNQEDWIHNVSNGLLIYEV